MFVCFLKTKQMQSVKKDMRLVRKYFLCSDDVSLGSGKNGSFDDRTEGSSLHEGNRWFLMMITMRISIMIDGGDDSFAVGDEDYDKDIDDD